MLCNRSQGKQVCLPLLLSKDNPRLMSMLKGLKSCEMPKPK